MDQSRGQAGQLVYHDLRPTVERAEDTNNHVIRVHLPGFRKEDFRVQVDKHRKLSVKGNYMLVEQVFEVPEETDIGKISGKFEEGFLTLVMPKTVPSPPPPTAITGEEKKSKEEKIVQRGQQPEGGAQKKEEAPKEEEMPQAQDEEMKDEENIKKRSRNTAEKIAEEPIKEEKIMKGDQSKEDVQREKPAASAIDGQKKVDEKKEEEPIRRHMVKRQESNDKFSCKEMMNMTQKWGAALKEKITEVEGWLDHDAVDDLLESINRNRKILGVAALAFTAGFFVSRKLR